MNFNVEKLSEDEIEATLYYEELADTIIEHGYCMDQIFNADETSLNDKMLRSMTLAANADKETPEAKKFKENDCSNACQCI